jgi:acylphosphatase
MIKGFQIKIYGKVQHVFFRASVQAEALKNGLSGYVKNLPDGTVYIEVEGEEERLNEFIDWCKTGPPLAMVSSLEKEPKEVVHFKVFQILR